MSLSEQAQLRKRVSVLEAQLRKRDDHIEGMKIQAERYREAVNRREQQNERLKAEKLTLASAVFAAERVMQGVRKIIGRGQVDVLDDTIGLVNEAMRVTKSRPFPNCKRKADR
jgi:chromosome segregation ATPase